MGYKYKATENARILAELQRFERTLRYREKAIKAREEMAFKRKKLAKLPKEYYEEMQELAHLYEAAFFDTPDIQRFRRTVLIW